MSGVSQPGVGELLDASGRPCELIPVSLAYTPADPYAVTATFADTTWVFARDLLRDGMSAPAGVGDVRVAPNGSVVVVRLSSPDGTASVALPAPEVRTFVDATDALVPPGAESALLEDWSVAVDRPTDVW